MEELLRFISTYEMGVYIIFGVVILFNLKKLLDGLTGLRKANFGLEKEVARKKLRSAITIIGLFLIFGLSIFRSGFCCNNPNTRIRQDCNAHN